MAFLYFIYPIMKKPIAETASVTVREISFPAQEKALAGNCGSFFILDMLQTYIIYSESRDHYYTGHTSVRA